MVFMRWQQLKQTNLKRCLNLLTLFIFIDLAAEAGKIFVKIIVLNLMDESSSFDSLEMSQSRHLEMPANRFNKSIGLQVPSEIEEKPIAEPTVEPIQVCNGIYKVMIEDMHIFEKYMYTSPPTSESKEPRLKNTSLAEVLHKIMTKVSFKFDAAKYNSSIAQVIMIMKLKIKAHWQRISSLQQNYYSNLSQSNTQLINTCKYDLKHSKMDNSPQRLYILDVFSLVLKHNRILRSQCDSQSPAGIISKKTIKTLFEIQDVQYYEEKFARSEHWLKFEQLTDFQQLLMLLSVVELKYRIQNYLKRSSTAKTVLNQHINLPFNTTKEYFNHFKVIQNDEDDKFMYKFSEIICFSYGDNINTKSAFIRAQIIDELTKTVKLTSFTERKRLFLNVKIKYKITLDSLYVEYTKLKKTKEGDQQQRHEQKMNFDLDNAEWIHLFDNKFPKTLDSTIANANQFTYKNKFFSTLFEKSEKRFKLLQRVVQAQTMLEKKVGRSTIYVSRFQYSFEQLLYSKSDSNSKTASTLTQQTGIKSYITIGTDSERVLFASISTQALESTDYEQTLKHYFSKEGTKHATLVLSQLSYQKTIVWSSYLKLCNYFKERHDTHVYIDNSIQPFASHHKLYSIIKAYLLDYSYLNTHHYFHGEVEKATNEVILLLGSKVITGNYEINESKMKSHGNQTDLNEKLKISQSEIAYINEVLLQIFAREPTQAKYEVLQFSQVRKSKIYKYSKEDSFNKLAEYASNKRQVTGQNASFEECLAQLVSEDLKRNYSKANLPNEMDQNAIIAKVLEKRGMKVRQIKFILKNVTKLLLFYELFFKMLRQECVKLKIELESAELQQVYRQEQFHINQIFTSKAKVLQRIIVKSKQAFCKAISSLLEKGERSSSSAKTKAKIYEAIEQN